MRALARVAKEVKFHLGQPERGKFKQFENFQIRLHFSVFSLCFTKFKITKYKQTQTKRKTNKQKNQAQKTKKNHLRVSFVCFVCSYRAAGSVNCARADRVTPDRYRAHFRFL